MGYGMGGMQSLGPMGGMGMGMGMGYGMMPMGGMGSYSRMKRQIGGDQACYKCG